MANRIRYPLKVQHRPDEPSYALLARTVEHNGSRLVRQAFGRFGVNGGFLVNNVDPGDVAHACQADSLAVARATPVATHKRVDFLGQTMHRDHYSVARRRWCPECLKEEPYHRGWWDVVAITSCPRHAVELAAECGCGKKRNWQSFGMTYCQAGHDLRKVGTCRLAPEDIVVDAYLVDRLVNPDHVPHPLLGGMSFGEAVMAMERLGQAWHDESGRLRRARKALGQRGLLNLGYGIVEDLDTGFVALLDRLVADDRGRRGKWGVTRAYGEFYQWVNEQPESPLASAMKGAIAEHARANLTLKSGHNLMGQGPIDNGYSLRDAADRCGVAFGKFRRIAMELGMFDGKDRRGQPARLDRAQVDEIAERLRGSKNLNEIALELGVEPAAVNPMIKDGLVVPLFHAGSSGLNQYDFPAAAAGDLLESLLVLPLHSLAADVRLLPLNMASQFARVTVSKGVQMVLAGTVPVAAIDPKASGLPRFLVSTSAMTRAARQAKEPGLTMMAAAPLLGLSYNSTADFVKREVLKKMPGVKGTFLAPEEIDRFKRTYVTVPELSDILGTKRSRDTIALLDEAGIEPACPRPPFWKVLYFKEEAVAAAKTIVAESMPVDA
ncbi:hypothetical protein JP75_05180 [Devosia riboflavina]|uniref:TniQ domain-containing protein n=1 Tax=Devosia riboflavina TaxID=46914 RepID=A0A087M634_9HYPH|nr:TniQ family protein [Devosia riboflavina]KFL32337.1 hypothetical protein JP75_05180 [Devosia riboflavina]